MMTCKSTTIPLVACYKSFLKVQVQQPLFTRDLLVLFISTYSARRSVDVNKKVPHFDCSFQFIAWNSARPKTGQISAVKQRRI